MKKQWIWVLGKKNILHGDQWIPFEDNWGAITKSIMGYPFKPVVLGRSTLTNVQHDDTRAPLIGIVDEWKVLSREDAAKKGIEQVDEEALYALVERYTTEPIFYVSPSVHFGFKDERGINWPAVIQHVAVVGQPAQQLSQPVNTILEEIALARKKEATTMTVEKAQPVNLEEDAGTTEEVNAIEDRVTQIEEALAQLSQDVAELKAGQDSDDDGGELAKLSRQVATLSRALDNHTRSTKQAEIQEMSQVTGQSLEFCRKVHGTVSREEWALLSRVPQNTSAMTAGNPKSAPAVELSAKDIDKRAREIARLEKITYYDALGRVNGGN